MLIRQCLYPPPLFFPVHFPELEGYPQRSGSRSIQKRSISAFLRSSAKFSAARALRQQHLPILKKLKVVLLPEEHVIPYCISSGFFLNHCYLQLSFWIIKSHYNPFTFIIQKSEMKITWALGLLLVVLSLWLFSDS